MAALKQAAHRLDGEARVQIVQMAERFAARQQHVDRFVAAYRHYCWPVKSLDDLKLAPFHLLASEGAVHVHQNHVWNMETLARICSYDPALLLATDFKVIDVTVPTSEEEGIAWWSALTDRGGEGMVIKPLDFVARGKKGLVQPAVKCRGPEYLRIIYGPDYTADEHLSRLRNRSLGSKSLAGGPRIRAGNRSLGAIRAPRTAAARARVRLRRSGIGERAGRSASVTDYELSDMNPSDSKCEEHTARPRPAWGRWMIRAMRLIKASPSSMILALQSLNQPIDPRVQNTRSAATYHSRGRLIPGDRFFGSSLMLSSCRCRVRNVVNLKKLDDRPFDSAVASSGADGRRP